VHISEVGNIPVKSVELLLRWT